MGPAAFHTRFLREMRRFEATWSVAVEATEPVVTDDEACWRLTTRGPNWRAETELRLVRWDDAIDALSERPLLARLVSGAVALGDFALAGALSRYFRTNWRYALFFLYPLALLVALAAVAFLAAHFASAAFGPVGAAVLGGV